MSEKHPEAGPRQTAVVTGVSNGIGKAIALRLARRGYDLVGLDLQGDPALPSVADLIAQVAELGRDLDLHVADVGDPEQVRRVVAGLGGDRDIAVLVHAAGVPNSGRRVAETDDREPLRLFGIHALGAFTLSSALLPSLRASGRGNIVFVSSYATSAPLIGGATYMMAKAALEALAQTLAVEEIEHAVRVNVVAPGLVAAGMGHGYARARRGVASAEELDAEMPLGRVVRADDVAALVDHLVSEDAALVTGQRIEVHGGRLTL